MTDSTGGRKPRVTPEDVLDVFDDRADRAEPLTSNELAEELACSRRTALNKLHTLDDRGDVASKKVGGRAAVWWVPLRTDGVPTDAADRPDESAEADAEDDRLPGVDFPGSREREECVDAVLAAREFLRENGPSTMREIVAAVMPEHSLGYDVEGALEKVEAGERFRGAWWRRVVKPGLKALDDVSAPGRGASDWRAEDGR